MKKKEKGLARDGIIFDCPHCGETHLDRRVSETYDPEEIYYLNYAVTKIAADKNDGFAIDCEHCDNRVILIKGQDRINKGKVIAYFLHVIRTVK